MLTTKARPRNLDRHGSEILVWLIIAGACISLVFLIMILALFCKSFGPSNVCTRLGRILTPRRRVNHNTKTSVDKIDVNSQPTAPTELEMITIKAGSERSIFGVNEA